MMQFHTHSDPVLQCSSAPVLQCSITRGFNETSSDLSSALPVLWNSENNVIHNNFIIII